MAAQYEPSQCGSHVASRDRKGEQMIDTPTTKERWTADHHFACHSLIMNGEEKIAETACHRLETDSQSAKGRWRAEVMAAAPQMMFLLYKMMSTEADKYIDEVDTLLAKLVEPL
jgi:hypothetical protein